MEKPRAPQVFHLADIELLWELVENRCVAVLVLLDNGYDKSNEFVPKVDTVEARPMVVGVLCVAWICLVFTGIELVAVLEKELIC